MNVRPGSLVQWISGSQSVRYIGHSRCESGLLPCSLHWREFGCSRLCGAVQRGYLFCVLVEFGLLFRRGRLDKRRGVACLPVEPVLWNVVEEGEKAIVVLL